MSESAPSSPDPSSEPTLSRARSLMGAAVTYAEARGQLLQIEAQEAVQQVAGAARAGIIGAAAVILGWLLIVPAGISLLSSRLGIRWEYLAMGVAGFHFIVGLIYLLASRRRSAALRPFQESINQFREDRAWIIKNRQKP
ncbi:MAG: phage holin family protein [Verrucomicrobiaceae bacterium]|nr:phage holin family protein [Verrucomicrobiaceae bacterium]